jgi:hypothetical protein
MTHGVPGRTSWARAIPASASVVCCTRAAGTDTGAIAPISRKGVTMIAWPASAYASRPSSIRTSKCSGELTLTLAKSTGSRSMLSRPPCTISAILMQSRAATSDDTSPDQTRSVNREAASARTR